MEIQSGKEGRINIISKIDGLVAVDSGLLAAMNRIENVLFTVVPDNYPVKRRGHRRGHEDRSPLYLGRAAREGARTSEERAS